jgi:hypothetical protein
MAKFVIVRDGEEVEIPYGTLYAMEFDGRHGAGRFEEFVRLLSDRRVSQVEVARRYSLSRERIRQLYNRILLPYLGETGMDRKVIKSALRVRGKFPEHTLRVWRVARRKGLKVSHINRETDSGQTTLHTLLDINGHVCNIKYSNNVHGDGKWTTVNIIPKEVEGADFCIVLVRAESCGEMFYILPIAVLKNTLRRNPKRVKQSRIRSYYLPIRKWYEYSENWPVDWHKYQNAWHLFSG